MQESYKLLTEKIEAKQQKFPKKPIPNEDVINRKVADLEYEHQTTSFSSNKQEREVGYFLTQIQMKIIYFIYFLHDH